MNVKVEVTAKIDDKHDVVYALGFEYKFPGEPESFLFENLRLIGRSIQLLLIDRAMGTFNREGSRSRFHPLPIRRSGQNNGGSMEDLAQDVYNQADKLVTAILDGDTAEAKSIITKLENKLGELKKELDSQPEPMDVGDEG